MGKTSIEWTNVTINPVRARDTRSGKVGWFCEKVSPGCKNCYAERMNGWRGNGLRFASDHAPFAEMFFDAKQIRQVLRWKKPQKIFVCDMTDIFHPLVADDWIEQIFAVMALADKHTFQILTKRPERMKAFFEDDFRWAYIEGQAQKLWAELHPEDKDSVSEWLAVPGPLKNVWLGTSVENQETADARIPALLTTPAAVRFISAEPLLGPIELREEWYKCPAKEPHPVEKGWCPCLGWVIVGGESGAGARPLNVEWIRSLVEQCEDACLPIFVKQLGKSPISTRKEDENWSALVTSPEYGFLFSDGKNGNNFESWPADLRVREWPE